MLNNFMKSTTANATSTITTATGEVKIAAYLNANISSSGEISFNQSISDPELYKTNKEKINADFTEFEEKVLNISIEYLNSNINLS